MITSKKSPIPIKFKNSSQGLSFSSLSKSKQKKPLTSQSNKALPPCPKYHLIISQAQHCFGVNNEENSNDQYKLFSQMLKDRKENQRGSWGSPGGKPFRQAYLKKPKIPQSNDYDHYMLKYQKESSRQSRRNQRKKTSFDKYFPKAPLIKSKTNTPRKPKESKHQLTAPDPLHISFQPVNFKKNSSNVVPFS